MSDLGRRRDKYRGRGVWFLPGLVLFGYGWFWLPLRVSESVGRIVNSVLLTVWMGLVRAAKQATDFGEGREGQPQHSTLSTTLSVLCRSCWWRRKCG